MNGKPEYPNPQSIRQRFVSYIRKQTVESTFMSYVAPWRVEDTEVRTKRRPEKTRRNSSSTHPRELAEHGDVVESRPSGKTLNEYKSEGLQTLEVNWTQKEATKENMSGMWCIMAMQPQSKGAVSPEDFGLDDEEPCLERRECGWSHDGVFPTCLTAQCPWDIAALAESNSDLSPTAISLPIRWKQIRHWYCWSLDRCQALGPRKGYMVGSATSRNINRIWDKVPCHIWNVNWHRVITEKSGDHRQVTYFPTKPHASPKHHPISP